MTFCSHAATACNYLKLFSRTSGNLLHQNPFFTSQLHNALQGFCASNPVNVGKYITELAPLTFTKADEGLLCDPYLIITVARAEPIY